VGLETSAALAVAALDLKLVRLLRAAMRPGAAGPGGSTPLVGPAARFEPRKRVEPGPAIEPRPHLRPEPAFEPRRTVRGGGMAPECCGRCAQVAPAAPEEAARPSASPVEPPWKVRPWEDRAVAPPRPVRKIKVVMTRSDSYCKGSVIDLFI
jgi:hypothetical protein